MRPGPWLVCACLVLSGCGESDAGFSGPTFMATVVTATGGAEPDAAIGDTRIYRVTGTMPRITIIADALLPMTSGVMLDQSGSATLGASPQQSTLQVVDASRLQFTVTKPTYDGGGTLNGTTSEVAIEDVVPYAAPGSMAGAYAFTVTSVTTGASVAVGDTGSYLVNGMGYVLGGYLVQSGSQWVAQASRWNAGSGAVETTRVILSANGGSGEIIHRVGATVDLDYHFTAVKQVLPTAGTGSVGGATNASAAGYTDTSYVDIWYPNGSALTFTIDAAASTVLVEGGLTPELFQIVDWSPVDSPSIQIVARRGNSDGSLPTVRKGFVETLYLELDSTGVVTTGGTMVPRIELNLIVDGDPNTQASDTNLGSALLAP